MTEVLFNYGFSYRMKTKHQQRVCIRFIEILTIVLEKMVNNF